MILLMRRKLGYELRLCHHTIQKCKKMTQKTHFWKSLLMAHSISTSKEGIWTKKNQIPCRESKVPNWQFLIWHFWFPPRNFNFLGSKYLHLKCFECAISFYLKMDLSFFRIQNLGQSRSKSAFSQKDTYLAFSFLFPSVLLSY